MTGRDPNAPTLLHAGLRDLEGWPPLAMVAAAGEPARVLELLPNMEPVESMMAMFAWWNTGRKAELRAPPLLMNAILATATGPALAALNDLERWRVEYHICALSA